MGINQALYWGLPVVTEDGPFQSPEINNLKDGINGYMVPENDLTALKNKIQLLLTDDNKRELWECIEDSNGPEGYRYVVKSGDKTIALVRRREK